MTRGQGAGGSGTKAKGGGIPPGLLFLGMLLFVMALSVSLVVKKQQERAELERLKAYSDHMRPLVETVLEAHKAMEMNIPVPEVPAKGVGGTENDDAIDSEPSDESADPRPAGADPVDRGAEDGVNAPGSPSPQ